MMPLSPKVHTRLCRVASQDPSTEAPTNTSSRQKISSAIHHLLNKLKPKQYALPERHLSSEAAIAREHIFRAFQALTCVSLSQDIQNQGLALIQSIEEKALILGDDHEHTLVKALCKEIGRMAHEGELPLSVLEKKMIRILKKIQKEQSCKDIFFLRTADQKTAYLIKEVLPFIEDRQIITRIKDSLEKLEPLEKSSLTLVSDIDRLLLSSRKLLHYIVHNKQSTHQDTSAYREVQQQIIEKELKECHRGLEKLFKEASTTSHTDNNIAVPEYGQEMLNILKDHNRLCSDQDQEEHLKLIEGLRSKLLYAASLYGQSYEFMEELILTVQKHPKEKTLPELLNILDNKINRFMHYCHSERFNYGELTRKEYEVWLIQKEEAKGNDRLAYYMRKSLHKSEKMHTLRMHIESLTYLHHQDPHNLLKLDRTIRKKEREYKNIALKKEKIGEKIIAMKAALMKSQQAASP